MTLESPVQPDPSVRVLAMVWRAVSCGTFEVRGETVRSTSTQPSHEGLDEIKRALDLSSSGVTTMQHVQTENSTST